MQRRWREGLVAVGAHLDGRLFPQIKPGERAPGEGLTVISGQILAAQPDVLSPAARFDAAAAPQVGESAQQLVPRLFPAVAVEVQDDQVVGNRTGHDAQRAVFPLGKPPT